MSEESGTGRSKRVLSGKQKRLGLLEKLRAGRNKYEVGELENVYDEVDEKEYSKKVLQRQDDDWIVDDGGCGYVEDGREIFDDDLDEESISKSKPLKVGKKRPRDVCREEKKGNVGKMLMSMPAKKKKEVVKIDEDDVLGNIIDELGDDSPKPQHGPQPVQKEVSERDYLKNLAIPKLKPKPIRLPTPNASTSNGLVKSLDVRSPVKQVQDKDGSKANNQRASTFAALKTPNPLQTTNLSAEFSGEIIPLADIKEEPIYVEDMGEELGESIVQAFDDDIEMIEAPKPVEIKTEDLTMEGVVAESTVSSTKIDVNISEDWNTGNCENDLNVANVAIDKSQLPLDGLGAMKFFYIDAHEELNQPGVVYLFGKVSLSSPLSFVSCCVIVRNIQRQIFLLPRKKRFNLKSGVSTDDDVSMSDVYEEFNNVVSPKYKIHDFKSKKVTKKFAFGKEEIPLESDYLEIRYSAGCRGLPADLNGETFSRIFGCRTSFLELLFLEQGIKGPGWLDVFKPVPNSAPCSWCKFEAIVSNPAHIVVPKSCEIIVPPLVLMTIVPQAVYNQQNKQTEIVAIACLIHNAYPIDKPPEKFFKQHFCLLTKPSDVAWPFDIKDAGKNFPTIVQRVDSERALLNCFLTKLFVIDADIIVGHDLSGFGIDLLMGRLAYRKIPNWSRLSRLRRANFPSSKAKSQLERLAVTGRLLCDIKVSAKELIRSRSYDLNTLCQNVLNFKEDKRPDTTDEDFKYSYSSGAVLYNLLWNLMSDASYILQIFAHLNILPLALQITNVAGNVMSRTLMGGRSERNEFLLLHAFYSKGYILPDKEFKKKDDREVDDEFNADAPASKSSRKKPSYTGGLVLDPKVGFYDDLILLMDFNSLYPSIIQEYNICFSTVPLYSITMDDHFVDEYAKFLPKETVEKGILPTEIRKLVESRRDVKKLLKNSNLSPELKIQYDIRQTALKLTANSMYGCLGFAYSRFYAKELAAMITAKGREILLNTKRVVESYGYDVIYGDTDSIMINTKVKDFEQVYSVGRKVKGEVNKFYKQVELDIDGVFKYMLLLRKKKYAAVSLSKLPSGELAEKTEMKGIDIVRRDWSKLAAEAGKYILAQILSDKSCDDKIECMQSYLETIRQDLEDGKVPLSLLEVTKQLTKPPSDYTDPKSLPHVLVALRMNSNSSTKFKQGDTVSYVICLDGSPNPATQRAYHSDELKSNENLKIDIEYYLSQQIHPVIARLCDPIEGIDAASIARCLGLDPTKYKRNVRETNTELDENEGLFGKDDIERFKDCVRFSFKCENPSCGVENVVDHPVRRRENGMKELFLDRCINADCKMRPAEYLPLIQNQLHLKVREFIQEFSRGTLVCENPLCGFDTTYLNPLFDKVSPVCRKCARAMHLEETPMHLYNQLVLFTKTFDLSRASSKMSKFDPETVEAYQKVHSQMDKVLAANKYSVVDLEVLFAQLELPKAPRKSFAELFSLPSE